MRTLLVDNHDSFTYNLFHHLGQVTGHEPAVIRNDEPGWQHRWLRHFDNVVISPGPGTPERASDLGLCRELIERADLPVLGICLGHQAIAHLHGATVGRAPEARHGRLSPVLHYGDDLFAELPPTFWAVRYHSLAVTDLPDDIEATAWTRDGVLMGLRHRRRPMWGVQFHPESICSEYGLQLLANFADLTRRWQRTTAPAPAAARRSAPRSARVTAPAAVARRVAPAAARVTEPAAARVSEPTAARVSEPTAARVAKPAAARVAKPTAARLPEPTQPDRPDRPARRLRVLVERLETRWNDEVIFDRLFRDADHAFWLDGQTGGSAGRFSIMGDAGGPLARVATADVWNQTVTVRSAGGTEVVSGSFFDWLARDLRECRIEPTDLPFDFALGWVGYLGYELKAECGGDRVHRSTEPDAALVFADRAVVFDHLTSSTYLLALAEDTDPGPARRWLSGTARRLEALAGEEPADGQPAPPAPVSLRHGRVGYLDLIAECQEQILAGETYEVTLTNMLETAGTVDWWPGYRFLRRTSPAPFGALLRFDGLAVLSTSPERFLRIGADGTVESKPIKGTRPRGVTAYEDELLRKELMASEKDRSENLMIVDLVRNDLGRCAELGSVRVDKLFDVESYATVHQLVSTVSATLRRDRSPVDCVRAAFPGGSMTGAPKVRTMKIIDALEGGPRGVYSGAIGYFSLSGAVDLSIVIRTAVVTRERTRYGVGGAIVALSEPEQEFEETAVKATPLLRLVGAQFPDRS